MNKKITVNLAVAIAIIINVYRLANNIDVRHIDKMKY